MKIENKWKGSDVTKQQIFLPFAFALEIKADREKLNA